jgi:hypothetical protein
VMSPTVRYFKLFCALVSNALLKLVCSIIQLGDFIDSVSVLSMVGTTMLRSIRQFLSVLFLLFCLTRNLDWLTWTRIES